MRIDITYGGVDLEIKYDHPEGISPMESFDLQGISVCGVDIYDLLSQKVRNEIMDMAIKELA